MMLIPTAIQQVTSLGSTDGWISAGELIRTGNFTFTESGDTTTKWGKGTRFRYSQVGVTEYGVVESSTFSVATTTVTLATNSDFAMEAGTLNSPVYSYMANPQGYPGWFNFSPTYGGFSVNPTIFNCAFFVIGPMCTWNYRMNATGTSNSTVFTITFPINPTHHAAGMYGRGVNNGADVVGPVMMLDQGGQVMGLFRDGAGTAWTASGGKGVHFITTYPF